MNRNERIKFNVCLFERVVGARSYLWKGDIEIKAGSHNGPNFNTPAVLYLKKDLEDLIPSLIYKPIAVLVEDISCQISFNIDLNREGCVLICWEGKDKTLLRFKKRLLEGISAYWDL